MIQVFFGVVFLFVILVICVLYVCDKLSNLEDLY